jgi:hypothetical protein
MAMKASQQIALHGRPWRLLRNNITQKKLMELGKMLIQEEGT